MRTAAASAVATDLLAMLMRQCWRFWVQEFRREAIWKRCES